FLGSANLLEGRVVAARGGGMEGGVECFRFEVETDWGAPLSAFGRVPFKAGGRGTAAGRAEGGRPAAPPGGAADARALGRRGGNRAVPRRRDRVPAQGARSRAARALRPCASVQGGRPGAHRAARQGVYGRRRLNAVGTHPFERSTGSVRPRGRGPRPRNA